MSPAPELSTYTTSSAQGAQHTAQARCHHTLIAIPPRAEAPAQRSPCEASVRRAATAAARRQTVRRRHRGSVDLASAPGAMPTAVGCGSHPSPPPPCVGSSRAAAAAAWAAPAAPAEGRACARWRRRCPGRSTRYRRRGSRRRVLRASTGWPAESIGRVGSRRRSPPGTPPRQRSRRTRSRSRGGAGTAAAAGCTPGLERGPRRECRPPERPRARVPLWVVAHPLPAGGAVVAAFEHDDDVVVASASFEPSAAASRPRHRRRPARPSRPSLGRPGDVGSPARPLSSTGSYALAVGTDAVPTGHAAAASVASAVTADARAARSHGRRHPALRAAAIDGASHSPGRWYAYPRAAVAPAPPATAPPPPSPARHRLGQQCSGSLY